MGNRFILTATNEVAGRLNTLVNAVLPGPFTLFSATTYMEFEEDMHLSHAGAFPLVNNHLNRLVSGALPPELRIAPGMLLMLLYVMKMLY